ncbi:hypothetical protein MRX96_044281 [Rhipicephalus microplus]
MEERREVKRSGGKACFFAQRVGFGRRGVEERERGGQIALHTCSFDAGSYTDDTARLTRWSVARARSWYNPEHMRYRRAPATLRKRCTEAVCYFFLPVPGLCRKEMKLV